jgi:cobalt/nickel transport system permease protein
MSASLLGHHHPHRHGRLQALPAGLKLALALVLIVGTVTVPADWSAWFAGAAVVLAVGLLAGGVSLAFVAKRLLVLLPFVLGVGLVNALDPAGRSKWLVVAARSILCLTTVVLVSNTTPFTEMLAVLRRIHVPWLLVTTIALMHRYLFVLNDEAERMRRARAGRTFVRGRGFRWRTLATVVGQLFIRASERAERIYDAMSARGWK